MEERTIFKTKQHWVLILVPLVGFTLLVLATWILIRASSPSFLFCIRAGVILVGLAYIVRAAITYATTDLTISDRRAVLAQGLLRRRRQEVMLTKIESVDVDQPLLCLLLGCGTVRITGTGGTVLSLRAAAQPFEARDALQGPGAAYSGQPC